MEQEIYHEDLADLIENVLTPLEKYFASLVDLGAEDREPRRVFIDDIGHTGLALTAHAQNEIRSAMAMLFEKIGRVAIKRAGFQNRMGVPPRKMIEIELEGAEDLTDWAKQ